MAAKTEEEVFNFEGNLEKGFYDWFASKALELKTSNNPQTLPDDFISVEATIGGATGHVVVKPNGSNEYGQYDLDVAFTVRTQRGEDTPSQTLEIKRRHLELVALCRKWLAVSNARGSLDAFITLYEINTLTPSGTERDTSIDAQYDETVLNYSGQFDVLTTAFPVL